MRSHVKAVVCLTMMLGVFFGVRTIAEASSVALFYNSSYVDTSREAPYLQTSLTGLGHTVTTFTGLSDASFLAALGTSDLLVIPELEVNNLYSGLSSSARTVLRDYVAGGGGMIIAGDASNNNNALLNGLFGYALSNYGTSTSGSTYLNSAQAAGTPFESGVSSLSNLNMVQLLRTSSLPAGALSMYSSSTYTSVFASDYGAGRVALLGFDWYATSGDSGWNSVLGSSVEYVTMSSLPGMDVYWLSTGVENWEKLSNWTGGVDPGSRDNVVITPDADATVNGPSTSRSVRTLTLGGGTGQATLNLRSGVQIRAYQGTTINANGHLNGGALTSTSPLTLNGGTINAGSLLNQDDLMMKGGLINTGSIQNPGEVIQEAGVINTGEFQNSGKATFKGGALNASSVVNSGTLLIAGGAVNASSLTNSKDMTVESGSLNAMTLRNDYNLVVNGGAVTVDTFDNNSAFVLNGGTFRADLIDNSGTMSLNGGELITGNFTNPVGKTLTLGGTKLVVDSLLNEGTIRFEIDGPGGFAGIESIGNAVVGGVVQFIFTYVPSPGTYQFLTAPSITFTGDVLFSGLGATPFTADLANGRFSIGGFVPIPEPASLMLVSVIGTLLRRRR